MTSLPKFSVENPVLVGVLMVSILIGGVYGGLTLVREMFPESRPNNVLITTPYPGATPAEVEKGISIKIEEAIKDIENIEKIETQITEGLSAILVEMTNDSKDIDQAVNDFKAAVDAIPRDELPEEAEETRVMKFEPMLPVISVALFGDVDEATLKDVGRRMRDDILLLTGITDVELGGVRKAELAVEVEPEKLVEYYLSLSQVSQAIRQTNLDLPAGQLKTPGQNIAVRTLGETDDASQINETIVHTTPSGQIVRVSDLGRVIDGFEDSDLIGRFNGKSAVDITVYKTGDQDAIEIAGKVKALVAGKQGVPLERDLAGRIAHGLEIETELDKIWRQGRNEPFPAAINIEVHGNLARFIEGRLDLLKRNGLWGLCLVFLSLLVFLNWRIAFWVMMGLVISVAGAIMLMHVFGATLNLVSMFGLIVVLGLIVDDAIVVGENVFARVERGEEPRLAAVRGTEEVTWPVVIAVFTTIGAFLPLMFIEGRMGDFMGVLPIVVTCALIVSLVEALSILPSHLAEWLEPVKQDLAHKAPRHWLAKRIQPWRDRQQRFQKEVLMVRYEKLLRLSVNYRYVTVSAAVAMLIVATGMIAGHRVPFVYLQKDDSEMVVADLQMPVGTPVERTQEAMKRVEQAFMNLPESELKTIWTLIGGKLDVGDRGATASFNSHVAQTIVELSTVDHRDRTSEEIIAELRKATHNIPGAESLKYLTMHGAPSGAEIEIDVTGDRTGDLLGVADKLKTKLAEYQGVFDIADDFEGGRREVQIELLDSARPLNLTTRYLATEVRGAFYGLEARTLQRDREDVDIRVRFPASRRRQIYELESMRIATPSGHMVPFCEVARIHEGQGFSSIRRVGQKRAVTVSGDVDHSRNNTEEIVESMTGFVRDLEDQYQGIRIQFSGNKRERMKSIASLRRDFAVAIVVIYVMLAGLFKSYIQPLVVLMAVPFGLNGAVVGHYIMGYPLTILSLIGLVALTGIVVNDGLILVDFINKEVAAGRPIGEAVISGGKRRLRPIILTSLTTIFGLGPMMAEQSFQARFLIPMAISISFGLAFATVLTLIVVPAIYMIAEDFHRTVHRLWYGLEPASVPIIE